MGSARLAQQLCELWGTYFRGSFGPCAPARMPGVGGMVCVEVGEVLVLLMAVGERGLSAFGGVWSCEDEGDLGGFGVCVD